MKTVKTDVGVDDTCESEIEALFKEYISINNSRLYFKRYRKHIINNDPLSIFLRKLYLLNPQMYGVGMEDRIRYDLNLRKVPSYKNRGDLCLRSAKKYFEHKFTMITGTNRNINIVQYRPDHEIDYLLLSVADVTKETPDFFVCVIPYEDLKDPVWGWSSAHGTGEKVFEKRKTIPYDADNDLFKVLCTYKKSYTDLINLFNV